MAIETFGVRVGVRVDQPSLLEAVAACLPPGSKPARSRRVDRLYSVIGGDASAGRADRRFQRLSLVYSDGTRIARAASLQGALDSLKTDLRLYVGERASRRIFVHAGVVGMGDSAVLIPGPSFTGKSRLVAALVRAGARYYSDEFAVLDDRGRVHPFATPLSLRSNDPALPPALSPKLTAGTRPLRVGLVVLSRYLSGAAWRPRTLSPGRGALALLQNALAARSRPRETLAVLRRVVAGAPVVQGLRGEAEEVVPLLVRRLEESAA